MKIIRNDAISVSDVVGLKLPRDGNLARSCTPSEAGISTSIFRELSGRIPILGIWLGHHCIGTSDYFVSPTKNGPEKFSCNPSVVTVMVKPTVGYKSKAPGGHAGGLLGGSLDLLSLSVSPSLVDQKVTSCAEHGASAAGCSGPFVHTQYPAWRHSTEAAKRPCFRSHTSGRASCKRLRTRRSDS